MHRPIFLCNRGSFIIISKFECVPDLRRLTLHILFYDFVVVDNYVTVSNIEISFGCVALKVKALNLLYLPSTVNALPSSLPFRPVLLFFASAPRQKQCYSFLDHLPDVLYHAYQVDIRINIYV